MRQTFRFLNISPLFAAADKRRQRRLRKLGRQEMRFGVEAVESRAMLAGSDLSSVTPDLITVDDTGYDGGDNYTNKSSVSILLNVSGINFAAGESVQLFVNGNLQGAKPVGAGTGNILTFTGVSLATEGNNQVTAKAFDSANAAGTASAALDITRDTVAPSVVSGAPSGQTAVSYTTGNYYEFQVAFDELVYTSNRTAQSGGTAPAAPAPSLPIVVGTWFNNDSPRQDKIASLKPGEGTGSTTLAFRHQVVTTDNNDADGVEIFATTGGNANATPPQTAGLNLNVVDKAGNVLGSVRGDHTDTLVTSVSQTGAAASQAFSGVLEGEHRVTPLSAVTLTILNAAFPVGSSVGMVSVSDFVLTRDGQPVNISGATLSWPIGSGTAFQKFQLGNLQQYTNAPGAYTLSFQDLGVIPLTQVSWVKSISTQGEIIAQLTPSPSSSNPRNVPVSKVDVQFQDNAGSAMAVVGVNTAAIPGGSAVGVADSRDITQFRLYKNGTLVDWDTTDPALRAKLSKVTITGSGANYTVNGLSAIQDTSGSYELQLVADDTITTIPPSNSSTSPVKLITSYSVSWQYVKPSVLDVQLVTADDTYYRAGDFVEFSVKYEAPVSVSGIPVLSLNIGGVTRSAAYSSGDGTDTLRFRYVVQNGDLDTDGIEFGSTSIQLPNGATITQDGANATTVFTPPNVYGVKVDGVRPTLQSVTAPVAKTYIVGDVIRYQVVFSEPMQVVTVGGTPTIGFTLGTSSKVATYVGGSDTAILSFEYQIQAGDLDTDGIVSASLVKLNGGMITDLAGNPPSLVFSAIDTTAVRVDGVAPTVTRFGSTKANGTYTIGEAIPITAVMSESVQAGSSIEVTLDTGATVILTAATQGRNLLGTYFVAADENTVDLTAVGFDDVNLLDVAGNPLGNTILPTGVNNIAGAKNIKIDTVFPEVPTVDSQVTRNTKPTLTGTANPGTGERLSVTVNGAIYGNVPVIGGFWALDLANSVPTSGALLPFFDGVYSVTAAVIDPAGNTSPDTSSGELTIDTTAPAVPTVNALVTNNRLPVITGTALLLPGEYLFVTVNGVTYPVTPGGAAWSLDLAAVGASPFSDGNYPVYATVQDQAGNISSDLTTNELTIDNVQPTIAISSSVSKLKGGETATITFTLSKPSVDFVAGDVTVANGSIGSFSGSGSVYTAVFTPTAGGKAVATISVAAAKFRDAAGNDNVASSVVSIDCDTVVPTVEIDSDSDSLRAGQTATITFVTSKPTSDFTNGDVTVSGLIKIPGTFVALSSTVYQVQVRPVANSTAAGVVSVGQGRFVDDYGNGNAAATISPSITIDTVAPTVTITTSKTALRAGETSTITFVLSEPSTDFTLSDINAYGGQVSNLAGSGSVYTAIFTPSQSSTVPGMVTVAALQFTDPIGNSNIAGALPTPIQIDTIVPTVTIASSASALKIGETATITFVLSEPTTTFDVGDVTAVGGVISGFIGSGMNYSATFTPSVGFQGFGTVTVNAGVFTDAAGNANLAGALTSSIAIDTVAPIVTISSSVTELRSGQTATITFTVSEPTNSFTGLGGVTAVGGTLGAFTKVSSTVYTAVFTPATNSLVPGGVTLTAGALSDLAGNGNAAATLLPRIAIDTQTPTVLVTTSKTKLKSGETATINFVLSESSSSFALSSISAVGGTLSAFKGGGTNYSAVFTPTVDYTGPGNVLIAAGAFTDDAGNGNIAGGLATAMSVDTLAPDAPVINTLYDDVAPVIGPVAAGGSTNDPSLLISGTSEAGATVTITSGGAVIGTAVADRNGRWALTTKSLTDGKYSFVTSAVDSNGNAGSPSSTPYPVIVDTVAPAVAAILDVADDKQPIVGTVPNGGVTNDSVLVISGTADAGSTVTIRSGVLTIGTTTASPDGAWIITTQALADGVYGLTAVASDDAGNAAKGSAPYGVTVDTMAPSVPTILSVEDDAGPVIGKILDGGVTDDVTPTISGEAEAGSTVILLNNGTYVTAAIADANGRWAITTPALPTGVTARFALLGQDRAGNVSGQSSPPFSVLVDTVAAKVATLSSTVANGTYAEGKVIPVNVSFSKPVVVTGSPILWLNTTPARYAVYAAGSGTNVLTFNYVVQLGDTAERLSNAGPTALNPSSGTIRTLAGVNAILTLPAATGAGSLGSVSNIVIDGSLKATATGFGTTEANAPKITSAVRSVTVTFNAPVTGFTASDVKLYYQGRPVSMAGTRVTGSGTTYTITFGPSTSLSGLYRLDIGRTGTAIASNGLVMTKVSSITWKK